MKFTVSNLILVFSCFTISFGQTNNSLSTEKKWTIADYQKFNSLLATLAIDAYPTLKNKNTNALFQKLITTDYKEMLRDENISVNKKMAYIAGYQQAIGKTYNSYFLASTKDNTYGIEISHLTGCMLNLSYEMIPVANAFLKTLDPNDKTYQIRLNGIEQLKFGMKQQLQGSFIMIKSKNDSTDEERIIIATYFSNVGAKLISFLDASDSKKIKSEIKEYILHERNVKIKTLLREVLQKL